MNYPTKADYKNCTNYSTLWGGGKMGRELLAYEKEARDAGYAMICGVDEAGRGPLAGPVFAAAVVLPENCDVEGIDDSKKLTPKKREILYDRIKETAVCFFVASASVEEIESINILNATHLAMFRAVQGLEFVPDMVLADGVSSPDFGLPTRTIIKGDSLSVSIAAASILAKVERDRFMLTLSHKYPVYNFAQHKGYGTALHIDTIRQYGPSPIHRMSFLKKILGRPS